MDIFYAFNDAYASLAGISIFSLLENNRACESIRFYIVDSGVSEVNKRKIEKLVHEYAREIGFFNMPSFESVIGEDVDIGRWNINVYSKLFVGSILPKNVRKVISIDCDTIINNSIDELWNTDISNYLVAGVNEAMSSYYRDYLGKRDKDHYLNSGLLLFNVEKIREEQFEKQVFMGMKKYGGTLPYLDQDLVNVIVPEDKMFLLHPKYNAITPMFCCSYSELIKARRASTYYTKEQFNEAKLNPVIIHFTTFFLNELRPWVSGSSHPKRNEFMKYKQASPWRDEPMWIDRRTINARIKGKIIKLLPKSLSCTISNVLHGVFVPKRTHKRIIDYLQGGN